MFSQVRVLGSIALATALVSCTGAASGASQTTTLGAAPQITAAAQKTPAATSARTQTPTVAAAQATATPMPTVVPASPSPTVAPTPSPTVAPTRAPATPPTVAPTAIPTSAPAGPNLVITRLNYDGVVPYTEADEFVEIRNAGGTAQNMSGWKIVSVRAGQTYSFPSITIAPGQTCRVYTNEVHPETCGLSWRRGSAVWNNTGDRANLVDPTGAVVSTSGYKGY